MFEFTREDFPRLADQDVGRVAPFIFGLYKKAIPIGIQTGPTDRLADDMTVNTPPNGGAIAASSPDVFDRFGDSGKLQIGTERISYSSKNPGTLEFIGITRGIDGTTKDIHQSGETIYEILGTFKYVICENPRMVHFTKSIDQVYLDGRRLKDLTKPPIITVNLDDRDVAANRSFVTLSVDVSSIPAHEIRTPLPAGPPRRVLSTPPSPYVPPPIPRWFGASGGGGGSVAGAGGSFNLGPQGAMPGASVGGYTSVSAPPRMVITYEFEAPVIGQLEVDVTGLQDDGPGTISGAGLAILDRPAWIVRTLLREAWGEFDDSVYNLNTFATTHTLQIADSLRWALAYEGQPFIGWKTQVLLEGKAHLFQWFGRWYYVYRRRTAPVFTFGVDEATKPFIQIGMTPRTDITTELTVTFNRGLQLRRFVLRSDRGIPRYGVQRNRALNLTWVYEEVPARLLGVYWLGQWDTQRLTSVVPTEHEVLPLEGLDTFRVTTPIMNSWGSAKVVFHVQDVIWEPERGHWMVTGAEADDTTDVAGSGGVSTGGGGLAIRGIWKLQRARTKSLIGEWRVGQPSLPSIPGAAVGLGLMPGSGLTDL